MAFFEDSSDLRILREYLSNVLRDYTDPSCFDEIPLIVTAGSGPFPESELDDLLRELGGDELVLLAGAPTAIDAGEAKQCYSMLVVLGRRDFSPGSLSDLIEGAGGRFVLRFVTQEALLEAIRVHGQLGSFHMDAIEVDPDEVVGSHPAFAWLEDRFGWTHWVDHEVPDWVGATEVPHGEEQGDGACGRAFDAEEEDESEDDDADGDFDGEEGGVVAEVGFSDEEDDDSNSEAAEQRSVWTDRPRAEQDKFIARFRKFGMLKAFEYTVGAKAAPDLNRRERLRRALLEDLPPALGRRYIEECGPPNSLERLKKMADSIATFARNAKRRRGRSMEKAIRHWEMDLAWMKQEWYRPGMGIDWPGTYVG